MDLWPIRAYQRLSWNFDFQPVGKAGMAVVAEPRGCTYETAGCPLPGPCLGWGIASEVITWRERERRWKYIFLHLGLWILLCLKLYLQFSGI